MTTIIANTIPYLEIHMLHMLNIVNVERELL